MAPEAFACNEDLHQCQHLIECIGRVAGDDLAFPHGAQPGELAFSQLTRGENAFVAQRMQAGSVIES